MSGADLAKALRAESAKIADAQNELRQTDALAALDLRLAAELALVLARLVEGKSIHEAFGAPGDFGYETPIGSALYRYYSTPVTSNDSPKLADLPRLTDEQRLALDTGYVAMAGVPGGEEPVEHTAGPWTLRKNSRGEECGAVLGADGMLVATTGYRASPLNDEDDANARLIAAAPELKDRLIELLDMLDGGPALNTAPARTLLERIAKGAQS